MKRDVLWVVALGIIMVGLAAGPDLWAAPGHSPARQTVPTRTPSRPPTETPRPRPTSKPKPTATAQPTSVAPSETVPAEGSSDPLLPAAGGRSARLHLGVAMIVISLLVLAVGRRRA
jgi:hypothetical protein